MSIRTVQFVLSANSISPTLAQSGGIQGEHNATSVEFLIEPSLLLKIQHEAKDSTPLYRIDAFTQDGKKISTEPKELTTDLITFPLSNQLTQSGADIKICLVISILNNNQTLVDLYSFPANLSLVHLPRASEVQQEEYSSLTELYKATEQYANVAKNSADSALINAERTENAKASLENGAEFVFLGGDAASALDIDLVVDDTLSEFSQNPIANSAVFKFFNEQINKAKTDALLLAHPVGSYYWSDNSINPSLLFGGEWEQIKDRFILAAGDGYDEVGAIGGSSTHSHALSENGFALIGQSVNDPDSLAYNVTEVAGSYAMSATHRTNGAGIEAAGEDEEIGLLTQLGGKTDSSNHMPPYKVAYCFVRIK